MPYRKLFFYTFAESRKQTALSPPFSLGTPDLVPTHLTSPSHATRARLIKRHKCGFQNASVPDPKRGVRSRIACFFFSPSLFLHFFFFFLFSLHFLNFRCVPSPCRGEEFCWAVGELHGNTIEYGGGEWRIYGRLSGSITVQYGTSNSSYRTDRIPVVIMNVGQGRHVRTIDRGREATWKLWEIEETFFFLSFFLQSDFG